MKYATIQMQHNHRGALKHFQLKLNGAAGVRQFSQSEIVAILVKLGEDNLPAAVEIARNWKEGEGES